MQKPIDIVMPWVDGSDPAWQAEKAKYKPQMGDDSNINRYRDWELLKYWFRGIEAFAPWVNKVHFITWGHVPEWMDVQAPKLHVVNHRDYIPAEHLPVFSSHPIELHMHRIAGLAEQFIYFNDDMYLTGAVMPEDFFKNGLPVDTVCEVPLRFFPGGIDHIIGNNMTVINKHFSKKEVVKNNKKQWFSLCSPKATVKNAYMLPVNAFSCFDNPHIPIPYLKSTLNEVWEAEPELLQTTSSHRFRNSEDVSQWLFRYWQFARGNFVQGKGPQGKFFSIGKQDAQIRDAIEKQSYKMLCLSDDDIHLDFEKEKTFLIELFEKLLPQKSVFEK